MTLVLTIKVVPGARKQQWTCDASGELKCYLKSPPVDGKANEELVERLSKALKVPKKNITVLSGLTARLKRVALEVDITREQAFELLGVEKQLSLNLSSRDVKPK